MVRCGNTPPRISEHIKQYATNVDEDIVAAMESTYRLA